MLNWVPNLTCAPSLWALSARPGLFSQTCTGGGTEADAQRAHFLGCGLLHQAVAFGLHGERRQHEAQQQGGAPDDVAEERKHIVEGLRIAVDNSRARLPLDNKFGIRPSQAPALLMAARLAADSLGVCFHVGSQSMHPHAYGAAIERANRMIRKAGVILDSLDVGGGFPAAYPGLEPAPLVPDLLSMMIVAGSIS